MFDRPQKPYAGRAALAKDSIGCRSSLTPPPGVGPSPPSCDDHHGRRTRTRPSLSRTVLAPSANHRGIVPALMQKCKVEPPATGLRTLVLGGLTERETRAAWPRIGLGVSARAERSRMLRIVRCQDIRLRHVHSMHGIECSILSLFLWRRDSRRAGAIR
jgi:hypothetical protein